MNDKHVYNVIVLTPNDSMGELMVIAQDDKDCLETIKKFNHNYQVLSFHNLESFKQKIILMEQAKTGEIPSLKSLKMQQTFH